MKTLLRNLFHKMITVLREHWQRSLETMALRHQLAVLERSMNRPRLSPVGRCFWIMLATLWSRWPDTLMIVQPDTVRRRRRQGWRHHLRWWHGRQRPGRPAIPAEMRVLIRRMSQQNVLWGAPRIQGELARLGIRVSRTTVAKYMARRFGPPSPTWHTFLRHHAYDVVASGVYGKLARRLHALSVQAIRALRWWLTSWMTSKAQRSAPRGIVPLTPLRAPTSVPNIQALGIVDRIRVPERSPPTPQWPGYHDPMFIDEPRAIETAPVHLAA